MAEKNSKRKTSATPVWKLALQKNRLSLVLLILVFVVFGNSLSNEYALDDEYYSNQGTSQTAQHIRDGFSGIPHLVRSLTFEGKDGEGYAYRPVVAVSFAIEHQFFGENPHVSHFISLLLYALTVIVLFRLMERWFGEQGQWFSFFVALLFLVHPLHTEVVDNIKSRDELLAMLGALGAFYFTWKHIETGRWYYLVLYPLCFLLGIFAKRTIIPYFFLFPLALWFFSKSNWKTILLYLLPVIAVALFSAYVQQQLLPPQQRAYLELENPFPGGHYGFAAKTATSFYILARYLFLHIIPHPLVYYYGFRYVPVCDWSNFLSIAGLLIYAFLGFVALRGLRKKTILSFGLLFYLVSIAAFANLLQPAPGLMAERFAYGASIGFCIALVWLLFRLFKTGPNDFSWTKSTGLRYSILFIAAAFSIRSMIRNTDWASKATLYGNDMAYLEESAKANMMLGQQHLYNGIKKNDPERLRKAHARFEKAVTITPDYYIAWNDLGTASFFLGDYARSKKEFTRSLQLKAGNPNALYSLGLCNYNLGLRDSAMPYFRKALQLDSTQVRAWEYVGKLLAQEGKPDEAIRLLERAAVINKESEIPYEVIAGICMKEKKDSVMAIRYYEKALERNPRNLQRIGGLAEYYRQQGNPQKMNYYRELFVKVQKEMKEEEERLKKEDR